MTMPPRLVTVLVPLQLTTLFLGFAICRKFIRLASTVYEGDGEWRGYHFPIPTAVWFFNNAYGLLLLLPVIWGMAACLRAESVGAVAEIRSLDSKVGIAMLVLLAGFSGWSVIRCMAWVFAVPHLQPI